MLKVSNLTLARGGKTLFSHLNCELAKGEALHIVGANGSGKSSLAFAIAGDLIPDAGEISLEGSFGFLMQSLDIDFAITVKEFIQMGNPKYEIGEVINQLNLDNLMEKGITQISQGQLQRVELAQLLIQSPDLYILDEPFSAQDEGNTELILEVLKREKKREKSLVLISHIEMNLTGLIDKSIYL